MAPMSGPSLSSPNFLPVTFSYVRQTNRRNLFECLESYDGDKTIVWDRELISAFNLVAGFRELQEKQVTHMYTLQKGNTQPPGQNQHVLFVIRPKLEQIDLVADNVRMVRKKDTNTRYHLVFVPRTSVICETRLKDLEMMDKFSSITEVPIHFFTTESDFASLESPHILQKCLLHQDWSSLYDVVCAIDQLEEVFGKIPHVYYKGDWAQKVFEMLNKKREQDAISFASHKRNNDSPLIDTLVMIDRWVDPITPLITQLTYEGLADEIFGIKVGKCKFPGAKFASESSSKSESGPSSSSSSSSGDKEVLLNSSDELFVELRDLNFNAVGPALIKRIKAISEKMESRHSASTVREYKEFVKRLPELQSARQSASVHTTIAEIIKDVTSSHEFLQAVQCEQEILNLVETEKPLPYIEDANRTGKTY